MEIGEYMRFLRRRKKISLRSLSSAVGVDPAHFSRIEAGKILPSESLILRLTKVLGCDLDELLLLSGRVTEKMKEFIKKDPEYASSVLHHVSAMSVAEKAVPYGLPDLVNYSLTLGEDTLSERPEAHRKQNGQFLTPDLVGRFMAKQLGPLREGERLLDPAIGSGVLACALIECAIIDGSPKELWIDGYEIDKDLCEVARKSLDRAARRAQEKGITVHTEVYNRDFILDCIPSYQLSLFQADKPGKLNTPSLYDKIIANPPYFKLNSDDLRVKTVAGQIKGHTNIYTLFMALAVRMLTPLGCACFIVPRSFCSGAYFSTFRQDFISQVLPLSLHLFESRHETFSKDSVLQENVIITYGRLQEGKARQPACRAVSGAGRPTFLEISTSKSALDLDQSITRRVSMRHFLGEYKNTLTFRLPTSEFDEQVIEIVDSWTGTLQQHGLEVSTGPVVAFRARPFLTDEDAVKQNRAVPLLWMHNIKHRRVEWPAIKGNKPQGVSLDRNAQDLSVRVSNYVLLRRFSAKEEPRRLIAAPFLADQFSHRWIGLENHLNYIYKKDGELEVEETLGLSALFNSALLDRYFRIISGHTQVNATELRALPLPPPGVIRQIGEQYHKADLSEAEVDIDVIVFSTLRESGYIPRDFPTIKETRMANRKIQEAQEILKSLGLPHAQQNEISALTLLVLGQLSEDTPWIEAKCQSLRIHDILEEIRDRYGREYAENTRETIRRQVIHQFEQAVLVVRNPDDLTLPTNSPRTHYALSDAAIRTIRAYRSKMWNQAIASFNEAEGALFEIYQKRREQHRVPLRLASGKEFHLSPGPHNELQAAVVEEFGPRFAPGAQLLYLGDSENKSLILNEDSFEELGIPISSHDKLPDIVFYEEKQNRLFLVEAVTSHGPVSPKRHLELEEMFKVCSARRVYVSAFPDFTIFKNFIAEIAWETEVWLSEIPDHLIHFNGDRFLAPR